MGCCDSWHHGARRCQDSWHSRQSWLQGRIQLFPPPSLAMEWFLQAGLPAWAKVPRAGALNPSICFHRRGLWRGCSFAASTGARVTLATDTNTWVSQTLWDRNSQVRTWCGDRQHLHLPCLLVIEKLKTPEGWGGVWSENCFLWAFRLFLLVFSSSALK